MEQVCKTCECNKPEDGDGITPFCTYYAEDIDDEAYESCFEWQGRRPEEDEYVD